MQSKESPINIRFSILLLLALWGMSACKGVKEAGNSVDIAQVLTQNTWVLNSFGDRFVNKSEFGKELPFMTLTSEGKLQGSTGCNRFNGSYSLKGNRIELDPGAMTKMACAGQGEKTFLNQLSQVASVSTSEDKLILLDDAGYSLLSFVPQP